MDDLLLQSLKDERVMLLAHRDRLRLVLEQIAALASVSVAKPRKNETLLAIGRLAEAALEL